MRINCGIDLVADERIQKNLENENFLQRIYHPSELQEKNVKKLASIFALKEAMLKALDISSKNWLELEVRYRESGKPHIVLSNTIQPEHVLSIDCSVTHENGLTQAIVVLLSDEEE